MPRIEINILNRKMKKIFAFFTLILLSNFSFSQKDSSLLKFVIQIQAAIEDRAKRTKPPSDTWPRVVILDSEAVPIDSLYKFNMKDVRCISINFDYPMLYGILSVWGIIRIHRKEQDEKEICKISNQNFMYVQIPDQGGDSALMKFVRQIRVAIEDRAKSLKADTHAWPKYVNVDNEYVDIDSLYQFKMADVKRISINFDFPATYGIMSTWGLIAVEMKDENTYKQE
ncbi:MAG: hypothetical protein QM727_15080 [Niabella sp.]